MNIQKQLSFMLKKHIHVVNLDNYYSWELKTGYFQIPTSFWYYVEKHYDHVSKCQQANQPQRYLLME